MAPDTLIVVVEPLQMLVAPPPILSVGSGFTVIVLVAVLLQPAALIPVTV